MNTEISRFSHIVFVSYKAEYNRITIALLIRINMLSKIYHDKWLGLLWNPFLLKFHAHRPPMNNHVRDQWIMEKCVHILSIVSWKLHSQSWFNQSWGLAFYCIHNHPHHVSLQIRYSVRYMIQTYIHKIKSTHYYWLLKSTIRAHMLIIW